MSLRATTAAVLAVTAGAAFAGEVTAERLFVSDRDQPKVTVVEPASGRILDTFGIKGPAALYRSASGQTVFAVQGDAGAVTAISTGIAIEDHGDHGDIHIEAPKLTGTEIAGKAPSHLVEHDGMFAAFFDGEGTARLLSETVVLAGAPATTEVRAPAPHHGVAVPYGAHVLLSEPNADDPKALPVGIRVVDAAGAPVGDIAACPDLHGEASSGSLVAFACATGLLIVTGGGDAPEVRHVAYPADLPEGKSTTLLGGRGLQYFLGNYGPDKVVLIDPTAEADAFRLVGLPTRRVTFAVDPVRARYAYVLTEDGVLHRLDALAGRIDTTLRVTDPYSMDGHWNDPRPRIAVTGEQIVITDPLRGKLHLIDAASFTSAGEIAVTGKPYNIVAVGGSGQTHDDGHAAAHDHDHDHDHADDRIYRGHFEDAEIADRTLSDWAGDWQSVYPLLQTGALDPVMAHKAEHGEMSAEEQKAYFETGYRTDVERITIDGDVVTFFRDGQPVAARYADDGHETLTYAKGNRGVRYIFRKVDGDAAAPQFIQFSDHRIAPGAADHYHLYWGDDRASVLRELTNWPTYYPASMGTDDVVREMIAH